MKQVLSIRIHTNELIKLGLKPVSFQSLVDELVCISCQLAQVDVKYGQRSSLLLRCQGRLLSFLLLCKQVLDQIRVVLQGTLPSLSIRLTQQPDQSILERQYLTLKTNILQLLLLRLLLFQWLFSGFWLISPVDSRCILSFLPDR